jgi:hypothetical protein
MDSPLILLMAIGDIVELALVVGSLHFAMRMYLRRAQPAWAALLDRRRVALLWLLALGAAAVRLTEDVLGGESGPIDEGILLFLHAQVRPR